MDKLKPCPFCGGPAGQWVDGTYGCQNECPESGAFSAEAWNRRASPDADRLRALVRESRDALPVAQAGLIGIRAHYESIGAKPTALAVLDKIGVCLSALARAEAELAGQPQVVASEAIPPGEVYLVQAGKYGPELVGKITNAGQPQGAQMPGKKI